MPLFTGPALRVQQPIGTFWTASIPADVLLEATVPDRLRLVLDPSLKGSSEFDTGFKLLGNQRALSDRDRIHAIANYIDSIDATFPNSIILAAPSIDAEDESESKPWTLVISDSDERVATLTIPDLPIKASVVDGQHRLYAFLHSKPNDKRPFELLCSVFFDIPTPVQAMVFATINTTQKPVPRGMALNLFGYNIDDEPRDVWSPEKLSVFIARRLNFDVEGSRLANRIKIDADGAPKPDPMPGMKRPLSLAAIVDGITPLVSSNHVEDRDTLRTVRVFSRKTRHDLGHDKAPLRNWYTTRADRELYELVRQYVGILDEFFWTAPKEGSMATRAVGVRALFGFLRQVLLTDHSQIPPGESEIQAVIANVRTRLQACRVIDFSDLFFEATGRGQQRMLNALRLASGLIGEEQLPAKDREEILRVVGTR